MTHAPDFDRHVIKNTPPDILWNYIDFRMLYCKILGIKAKYAVPLIEGKISELRESPEGEKTLEIGEQTREIFDRYKSTHIIPSSVYQFFKCKRKDETTIEIIQNDKAIESFTFPKTGKDNVSLSDYMNGDGEIALFITSCGKGVIEEVARLKEKGEFINATLLQSLCIRVAEAYAEYLHQKIRELWGIPDSINITMRERFLRQYAGGRFSFGYPACPNIEDQEKLFQLLKPENDIDVKLTDGFMMEPEASVSAVVFREL